MGTSFKLQNGLLLISTEAPGGVYNAEQLKKLASLCDGEDAVAKATEDQRLALFVPPAKAAAVAAQLKSVGLGVRHYQDGLHQPINCLGALCGDHLQDAMGTSMDLADELAGISLAQPLKIGINGCARCCLATHTLDISVIGDTSGYRVSLGGKNSQLPEMASFMAEGVPAAKLPKLIAKVVAVYKELAQAGESLQEVMERAGTQKFIATLAPYSQDAAHSDPFEASPSAADLDVAASADDLKIDDLSGDDSFDSPGIDAAMNTEGLGAEPSFDDSDLGASDLGSGPEATDGLGDALEADPPADLDLQEDDGLSLESAGADLEAAPPASAEDELGDLSLESLPDDLPETAPTLDATDEFAVDDLPTDEATSDPAVGDQSFAVDDDGFAVDSLPGEDLALPDDFTPEPAPTTGVGSASEQMDLDQLDESVDLAMDPDLQEESLSLPADPLVMDTPAPAATLKAVPPAPPVADEDELVADEIAEADADAFEEKLNASIADEGALPEVEDLNSSDRMAAMELVNSAGDQLPVEGGEQSVDDADVELSLDSFDAPDAEESVAADLASDEDSGADVGEAPSQDPLAEAELELAPDVDLDLQAVAEAPAPPKPVPNKPAQAISKEAPRSVAGSGFDFTGLDITAEGKIALQFASGAALEIDPNSLVLSGRRELKLAGKSIVLVPKQGGVNVEVDGVAIFVPQQRQAAA